MCILNYFKNLFIIFFFFSLIFIAVPFIIIKGRSKRKLSSAFELFIKLTRRPRIITQPPPPTLPITLPPHKTSNSSYALKQILLTRHKNNNEQELNKFVREKQQRNQNRYLIEDPYKNNIKKSKKNVNIIVTYTIGGWTCNENHTILSQYNSIRCLQNNQR